NFLVRKDTLLGLPLAPMDVLLTQLYGMIMILNLFGIVAASCMVYNMEFKGSAIKKMYMLPMSVPGMYLCKFLILTVMLFVAAALENLALMKIGMSDLPQGTFEMGTLLRFTGYSFLTSMPVLSFMVLISSRFENMWVPLGVGVAGFLSGMALASSPAAVLMAHPFIVMFKPAVAMSAQPDMLAIIFALAETLLFLGLGLWMAKSKRYE
ncbi:MAG: ABC transporter permease, partial [Lachnospiraceae bacterium]|nr:ABC transporter permease [Lachnospiraceae bacterium]